MDPYFHQCVLFFLAPAVLAQPGALEVGSVSTLVSEYVSEYVRGKFSFFHSIGSNYK